jgi:hypothetical protein
MVDEAARRYIVEQARANNALEGLYPSPEQEAGMELWIQDKITIEELIEQAKQRHTQSSAVEN